MDLRTVVRHYKTTFRARSAAELESFRSEDSLSSAVRRAALAKNPDGARYSHQRRRKQRQLDLAAERLLGQIKALESASNFAKLWERVTDTVGHLADLGPLYIYDTALRIGAKKGTLPTRIYLHAGTQEGAKLLDLDAKKRKALDVFEVPLELRELEPHEIEDVLCIYKRYFAGDVEDVDDARACWTDDIDDAGCDD